MQTLSGRWRLVGVAVVGVAAVLGLTLLRPASPTRADPTSSRDERLANFRQRTAAFLADPASRRGPVQVLVSFRRGYSVPAAFQELKRLAPQATPLAVMAAIDDSIGIRQRGLCIDPLW